MSRTLRGVLLPTTNERGKGAWGDLNQSLLAGFWTSFKKIWLKVHFTPFKLKDTKTAVGIESAVVMATMQTPTRRLHPHKTQVLKIKTTYHKLEWYGPLEKP